MDNRMIQLHEDSILQCVITIIAAAAVLILSLVLPYPMTVHTAWFPVILLSIVFLAEGLARLAELLKTKH
ncbi:MAG: hypothetical protein SOW08_02795 [Lachnospiraceae bacterium]|nr:hypothetical protein [Lachnospiraceae bacterium]